MSPREIDVRRGLVLASCAAAATVALYSCSMHAAITTDATGRVVEVSALRFESSLRRVALAMLVAGGQVAFELRWPRAWFDQGAGDEALRRSFPSLTHGPCDGSRSAAAQGIRSGDAVGAV
jgi:hypothetical protein